jgi:hypothetical protein
MDSESAAQLKQLLAVFGTFRSSYGAIQKSPVYRV